MRAKAQIDKKGADLDREDMARHLGAHLCRCTGYVKILDAIEPVAEGKKLAAEPPGGIGTSGTKYEGASSRSATAVHRRPARARACCTPPSA